ncbi:4-galactosyl-N-acetylglucosaminide 3-alpha-L-fucosyltransferase FUT5-like [Acropora millepora]|uniref:4-galactosyl-N-acetylglucosaminide 3-alpha-L-fucosyltransferase FUT5-like n=1 Tax=Acropora millepora TaxID=45264 RepID=UPI001CF1FF81|nr:4-galactosyl-N-acetylglucosaminide 3-alpha-L-fucosyltransferase FUT5-like [Acropora millepora]
MTTTKQLLALAIIIGAIIILAVQGWLLSGKFERTSMLRKKASNSAIANVERRPLESKIAKSVMFRKKEAYSSITKPAMKVILFYTTWFGLASWPVFGAERNVSCNQVSCRFTYNRDEFPRSAALIFHGWDLPSETVLKEVEKRKPSKQRWIYFLMESPVINAGRNPALFNGMFNWTFTYRIESDFFVSYGHYGPLSPDEIDRKPKNYAEGKDKLVAWAVSHCGMLRDGFVKKLLQYIKVDIFGSCANKFNQQDSCPRGSQECNQKLQRYKFYLAFENSFCIDYITEKYWETPLSLNMVPVVMGGASYENEQLAIPGSFINVVDFESVEALAKYLMYLNSNDTAYNEYFMWKRKFKPTPLMPGWPCRVCAALNNDSLPAKVYDNLGEFWGVEKTCGRNEDKVRKLIAEANSL